MKRWVGSILAIIGCLIACYGGIVAYHLWDLIHGPDASNRDIVWVEDAFGLFQWQGSQLYWGPFILPGAWILIGIGLAAYSIAAMRGGSGSS